MAVPTADLARQIDVSVGRVDVLHRLALAVEPRDAVTARPVGAGTRLRVGIETARALATPRRRRGDRAPLDPALRFPAVPLRPGAAFVLTHGGQGDRTRNSVTVRIDDPSKRWLPRRFDVPLWTAAEVEAPDAVPPASPPVPARSRLLLPWLLPGPAYPAPSGATGVRLRVTRAQVPVRWVRVEAFGPGGLRVGWGHGDEQGEVLLLVADTGALPPPAPTTLDVAVRVHAPAPAAPAAPGGTKVPDDALLDPLADLPVEAVARSSAPPTPQDLDNDLLRGVATPAGYVTAPDLVVQLPVGTVISIAHDVP